MDPSLNGAVGGGIRAVTFFGRKVRAWLFWLVLNPENSSRPRNKFLLNPDQVSLQDSLH